MDSLIRRLGRRPRQRTTLYADAPAAQQRKSYVAGNLMPPVQTPLRKNRTRHAGLAASC
jgi:hypothetical protein